MTMPESPEPRFLQYLPGTMILDPEQTVEEAEETHAYLAVVPLLTSAQQSRWGQREAMRRRVGVFN